MLELHSDDKYALKSKGFALYNLGNYTEVIEFADKVLALYPNDTWSLPSRVDSLNVKAASYLSLGNYTEAIEFADKVLEKDPNQISALR